MPSIKGLDQKHIDDILEYETTKNNEQHAKKQVIPLLYRFVTQLGEEIKEPKKSERIVSYNIDNYFDKLKYYLSGVIDFYRRYEDLKFNGENKKAEKLRKESLEGEGKGIAAYNQLAIYIKNYANRNEINNRDRQMIEDKFNEILPFAEQVSDIANRLNFVDKEAINQLYSNIRNHYYEPIKYISSKVIPANERERYIHNPLFENDLKISASLAVLTLLPYVIYLVPSNN